MQERARQPRWFVLGNNAQTAVKQFVDHGIQLDLCETRTDAAVNAMAKGDMAAGVFSADIEPFRIRKDRLVAIA